jgi:hypothetical protein
MQTSSWGAQGVFIVSLALFSIEGAAAGGGGLAAEDPAQKSPRALDQIETAVKNAAPKLEQEVTGLVKKLEDSETSKKVGHELKRSAEALGEKVEQAGKKLKDSFKSE